MTKERPGIIETNEKGLPIEEGALQEHLILGEDANKDSIYVRKPDDIVMGPVIDDGQDDIKLGAVIENGKIVNDDIKLTGKPATTHDLLPEQIPTHRTHMTDNPQDISLGEEIK